MPPFCFTTEFEENGSSGYCDVYPRKVEYLVSSHFLQDGAIHIVWFQKISIPPHGREWKFRGVGGVIGPGISGGEGGKGCCFDEFFSRPVSIFLLLYVMFCCLH